MVTNCLLFFCRAGLPEQPAPRDVFYPKAPEKSSLAPAKNLPKTAGKAGLPLTNPAEVAKIEPYLNILRG